MTEGRSFSIIVAATPAIAGSAMLMHAAGVPRGLIAQQVLIFLVPAIAIWLAVRRRYQAGDATDIHWMCLALAACLVLPVVARADTTAARWLHAGPVRLYIAPVVLPSLLLLQGRTAPRSARGMGWCLLATVVTGVALLLHPDAAQLTAFALASMPVLLWREGALPSRFGTRVLVAAGLVAAAGAGWQRPDPMAPVDHVEGALRLAGSLGPVALAAAMTAVLLPPAVLLWHAWRARSPGLLAVAIYYVALVALAPLGITPVPLLGFGAGPILGYLLMVLVAARVAVIHSAFAVNSPALR